MSEIDETRRVVLIRRHQLLDHEHPTTCGTLHNALVYQHGLVDADTIDAVLHDPAALDAIVAKLTEAERSA